VFADSTLFVLHHLATTITSTTTGTTSTTATTTPGDALQPAVTLAGTGCTGLQALNPLCYAVQAVGGAGGALAGIGVNAVLSGLSHWVASGAEWLLGQIGSVLTSTTSVDLGASWFQKHYAVMTALAGIVVLPLLVLSTLQAIYRQSASHLLRTFFVQLPLALLFGVVAVQIVVLFLSVTDDMSSAVSGSSGADINELFTGMTHGLLQAVGDPTLATFVLMLVGLLVATAAFVLWLELLVRAAAVYVAVLFLPMALAALVWPAVSHWCRRLMETLAALILSKFVIVATLSLAAGAVASGGSGNNGGFSSVLAGGALLVLATFVPFSILRLIPLVEAGAIGHLEAIQQRGSAAVTGLPRRAAQFALSEGMAAHGAAKLAAMGATPGTGLTDEGLTGSAEDCTEANGGLIADADGMMLGLPVDHQALAARWWGTPQPRGPKPVLDPPFRTGDSQSDEAKGVGETDAMTASAASIDELTRGGAATTAVGSRPQSDIIGKPGPFDRRYALGTDAHGLPVIRGLPPLRERPPGWLPGDPLPEGED
jgi:hypothetical protein